LTVEVLYFKKIV